MLSASASLGLSLLWDTDFGLSHVDKYTYSSEEYIKAGALLATGILNCGIRTEADAAMALLCDQVDNKSVLLRTNAIVGYAVYLCLRAAADPMILVWVSPMLDLIEKTFSLFFFLICKTIRCRWKLSLLPLYLLVLYLWEVVMVMSLE
jgi:hypothetical protein